MRPLIPSLIFVIVAIMPMVSRADTLTIKGSGNVVTFSLPEQVNTGPDFSPADPDFPLLGASLFGDFGLKINGVAINSTEEELFLGQSSVVLVNIPCPAPFDPYNPCFLTVAFDGTEDPHQILSGPNSNPILNLGTYSGISGSGFPAPNSPLTLTISSDTSPVPEPSSVALLATGLLFMAVVSMRRQHVR